MKRRNILKALAILPFSIKAVESIGNIKQEPTISKKDAIKWAKGLPEPYKLSIPPCPIDCENKGGPNPFGSDIKTIICEDGFELDLLVFKKSNCGRFDKCKCIETMGYRAAIEDVDRMFYELLNGPLPKGMVFNKWD